MAAIRPAEIPRFLASGCREARVILVHGPDEGAVRSRVKAIVATLAGSDASGLARVDLDAEALNADPARLLDEANAIGLFTGPRVVVVAQAGRLAKGVWQPLLEVPPLDSTIVFLADELTRSAPLRVAVEQARGAASLACYPPERQELQRMIETRAHDAGLAITPVARTYLAELLGADLALSELEIDKLILYCRGRMAIEVADIDAMIVDTSDVATSEAIDRAFEGRLDEVEAVTLRSFREGINPSGLLAMALNHALLLRRLAIARAENAFDAGLRSERIFFRREDRVRAQAAAWDVAASGRAIGTLALAQDQGRRSPGLEEVIAIRALWAVALASRRR